MSVTTGTAMATGVGGVGVGVGVPAEDRSARLRAVLRLDATSTAFFGVLLLAGGPLLRDPLGLPLSWSVPFGVAMLLAAAGMLAIARRPRIGRGLAWTVVEGNVLCAVGMVVLAFGGFVDLTGAGVAFMLFGALVVAAFAELEFFAHRRAATPA